MGALSALYAGVNGFTSTCLPVFPSIWQCFPMTTVLAWLSSSVHIISDSSFIISSASYVDAAITSYIHWLYIDVCGCCILLKVFEFTLPVVPLDPNLCLAAELSPLAYLAYLSSQQRVRKLAQLDIVRLAYSWPA